MIICFLAEQHHVLSLTDQADANPEAMEQEEIDQALLNEYVSFLFLGPLNAHYCV